MKKILILIYFIFSISIIAEYYKKGNEVYYEGMIIKMENL